MSDGMNPATGPAGLTADNAAANDLGGQKTAFETVREKVVAGVGVVKEKASGLVDKVREATSRGNSQEGDKPSTS